MKAGDGTPRAPADLGGAARRSLLLSLAGRYGAVPLRLASMVVLARLLAPAEFGAYAAALAAVQLAGVLADIGTTQYLVRAPVVEEASRRAAFGLALLCAAGLALPLVAAGLLLPAGWAAPGLGPTLAVAALGLLVQPAVAVLSAGLQRALRFGPIALAGLAGAAVQTASAVGLAALGLGPVALGLAGVLELLVVAAVLARHQALPRPSLAGWRPVFGFGWVWSAIGGLRQAGDAGARLATGLLLGAAPLGLLSRAQAVVQIFDKALLDGLSPVVLPALAAAQRAGRPAGPAYLHQVACLAALSWPFFGALALLARPVVLLLLGPGWEGAVTPLRWLCLAGLFLPLSALVLPYLVAAGALREWLPVQAALQSARLALVVLGALHSIAAVAAVLGLEAGVKALAAQRLLGRHLGLDRGALGAVLARAVPPALAALGAAAATLTLPPQPPWIALALAALAALPAWLLVLLLLRHPLIDEAMRLLRLSSIPSWPGLRRSP